MNRNVSRNVPRNKLVACLEGMHIFILLLTMILNIYVI
jgi:hypothetical protein